MATGKGALGTPIAGEARGRYDVGRAPGGAPFRVVGPGPCRDIGVTRASQFAPRASTTSTSSPWWMSRRLSVNISAASMRRRFISPAPSARRLDLRCTPSAHRLP